jgi:hypothetical protein
MDRIRHNWNVTLQREDGEVLTEKVAAYWDPGFEGINDTVGHAARTQAHAKTGKRFEFAVIAVAHVD